MRPLEVRRSHAEKEARVVVTLGERRGWDLREEVDDHVVRRTTYTDWHRVERALRVFEMRDELAALSAYSTKR